MLNLQRTEERRDLADFVRERRTRTKPQDVGLPSGSRRRTPGLRREEVAQLAGVSVTWYTWFEQGRDIQVSSSFLEKVSVALRLDAAEKAQLFALAQRRALVPVAPASPVAAATQALALSRRDLPAPIAARRAEVVSMRLAPDAESHRINEAIRKVITTEEARTASAPVIPTAAPKYRPVVLQISICLVLAMIFLLAPY
jgi:transcriptional regulator with XRE-family HTH domain